MVVLPKTESPHGLAVRTLWILYFPWELLDAHRHNGQAQLTLDKREKGDNVAVAHGKDGVHNDAYIKHPFFNMGQAAGDNDDFAILAFYGAEEQTVTSINNVALYTEGAPAAFLGRDGG